MGVVFGVRIPSVTKGQSLPSSMHPPFKILLSAKNSSNN
jgi:hypothetical protein